MTDRDIITFAIVGASLASFLLVGCAFYAGLLYACLSAVSAKKRED